MEAGPRDTAHGRNVAEGDRERGDGPAVPKVPSARTGDGAHEGPRRDLEGMPPPPGHDPLLDDADLGDAPDATPDDAVDGALGDVALDDEALDDAALGGATLGDADHVTLGDADDVTLGDADHVTLGDADDGPLGGADDVVEDGVSDDGPLPDEMFSGPQVEVEIRPRRRLSAWHLAPVVGLAAAGSLMFAFPLAFDFGDSGAVIAMLGVLICSCAAGWGLVAARKVGQTWPGLPPRGSGRRPDWRIALAYAVTVVVVVLLAVWRVARLR